MKVYITGANGFIGSNLVNYYDYMGWDVLEHNRDLVASFAMDQFKPDVVINCGAEIYDAENMVSPNVGMVLDILEYVKANPNTKLIQIGSSSEYGPVPRASKETDRINPIDMYQATKGAATLLCQGYARQYQLDISIARPYSVYGPGEKPHRLFPKLWKAFMLDEPMKLYHGVHDFIFIDDFVKGIDTLIKAENKPLGDIVNFGSGKQYTNFAVLRAFERITKKTAPVEYIKEMSKTFESDVWMCDTSYAKQKYGFEAKFSLEEGITKFLKFANYKQENL